MVAWDFIFYLISLYLTFSTYLTSSQLAKRGDEEGNAEVHAEAMEDRERDKVFATIARDDRQGGVHRCRTTNTDGSQRSKEA